MSRLRKCSNDRLRILKIYIKNKWKWNWTSWSLEAKFQGNKSFQFTCYKSAKEREFHNCQISIVTEHTWLYLTNQTVRKKNPAKLLTQLRNKTRKITYFHVDLSERETENFPSITNSCGSKYVGRVSCEPSQEMASLATSRPAAQ